MRHSTIEKIKSLGLDPIDFITETPANLTGRVVLVDPKHFGSLPERCLFKATGGFGCHAGLSGTCIFAERLSDKAPGRIERYDVIAVRTRQADLVAADAKVGEARNARDQIQKAWKGDLIPADHPVIAAYNEAAADYETARLALENEEKAKVEAGKQATP